jgi:hypothetical protein
MKVYTVYLNGDRGWTGNKVEGFYNEVLYAKECEVEGTYIPTEEDFNNRLLSLNIGDSYTLHIGEKPTSIKIKCEDMSEDDYNDLDEFAGW